MNAPFSDKLFTITIHVGRIPEIAAILKGSIKNLIYDDVDVSLPRSEIGGDYLEPLFVWFDWTIKRRYAHRTKAYCRYIGITYLTCRIGHHGLRWYRSD